MATFTTPTYVAQNGAAGKSLNVGTLLERDVAGKERVLISSYTSTGAEATNDLIQFGLLPIGAKVIPGSSYWITTVGSIGTTVTVSLGDQTTAARWSTTQALAGGGFFALSAALGSELVPVAVTGTGDNVITAKLTTISSFTAAKVVTLVLKYILP
jgi:hypothetical protein